MYFFNINVHNSKLPYLLITQLNLCVGLSFYLPIYMDKLLMLISSAGLHKYTQYKLRVAASTRIGESPLSDEDDIYVLTPEDGMEIMLMPIFSLTLINTLSLSLCISLSLSVAPFFFFALSHTNTLH